MRMHAAFLKAAGFEGTSLELREEGKRAHNLLYWQGGDFSPWTGASFALWEGGKVIRGENVADLNAYATLVRSGTRPVASTIVEEGKDAMFTFAMMGLRLSEGFSAEEFERRFGTDFAAAFPNSAKNPFIEISRERVRLNARGFELMNAVLIGMLDEI